VDEKGKIEYLKTKIVQDSGCNLNDSPLQGTVHYFNNCYDSSKFEVESQQVLTDTASNTWCRSPGTTDGVAFIEQIMEHIAADAKLDPLEVRMANLHSNDNAIPELVADVKKSADYENRKAKVNQFNAVSWKNLWVILFNKSFN